MSDYIAPGGEIVPSPTSHVRIPILLGPSSGFAGVRSPSAKIGTLAHSVGTNCRNRLGSFASGGVFFTRFEPSHMVLRFKIYPGKYPKVVKFQSSISNGSPYSVID